MRTYSDESQAREDAAAAALEMGGPFAVYAKRQRYGLGVPTPEFLISPAWGGAAVRFPGGVDQWVLVVVIKPSGGE